jgi:Tat protein secretion system quality control protein TatD with DNase activity
MKSVDIHTHFPEISIANICIAAANADNPFSLEEQIRQASFSLQNDIPFSFGIHPWQVAISGDDIEDKLVQLDDFFSKRKKNVLMGEIGLDLCRENTELQKIIFERQLDIATKHKCPVITLHCVKSLHLLPPILNTFRKKNRESIIIIHGFCGSIQDVQKLSNYDVYFSFSAKLLSCSKKTTQAAAFVDTNRILTETYIDKPQTLSTSVSLLSLIRRQKIDDCAEQIFYNATKIFEKIKKYSD